MKKRLLLLILLFLIPLGGGWYWYQQKPEQKINDVVDLFLEHVEHRKVSIRKPDDVENAFNETLADKINLQLDLRAPFPIPSGEITREEILGLAKAAQGFTAFIEITEVERSVKVIGAEAQVYLTANVRAGMGKEAGTQTWEFVFDLEKEDIWMVTGIRGTSGRIN